MELKRGVVVIYKGKPHMYVGASRFLKDKHMIARGEKNGTALTTVKTTDFKLGDPNVPYDLNIELTSEQESRFAKF